MLRQHPTSHVGARLEEEKKRKYREHSVKQYLQVERISIEAEQEPKKVGGPSQKKKTFTDMLSQLAFTLPNRLYRITQL